MLYAASNNNLRKKPYICIPKPITMEKIIWGVIGAGDVCEVKSVPAMYGIPHSEVKIIMRRDAARAADYAQRHGIGRWTTNVDELLSDPEINAVYIATPPESHARLTEMAARAGKAVYVEKPMATTFAECNAMIEACRNAGVPLFVAYYRRTLPGFLKVKELIDNGAIGDVRYVRIEMCQPLQPDIIANSATNWRVLPEIAGGGYFHDLASHQLDYLDFLFGPVVEAQGITANQAGQYPADDIVGATFRFGCGIIGSGTWCFSTHAVSQTDNIRIVGSEGEVSFNTFGDPMLIQLKRAGYECTEYTYHHTQPIQQPLIQCIVDELRGRGATPSTGVSGARTAWVMEQIAPAD